MADPAVAAAQRAGDAKALLVKVRANLERDRKCEASAGAEKKPKWGRLVWIGELQERQLVGVIRDLEKTVEGSGS